MILLETTELNKIVTEELPIIHNHIKVISQNIDQLNDIHVSLTKNVKKTYKELESSDKRIQSFLTFIWPKLYKFICTKPGAFVSGISGAIVGYLILMYSSTIIGWCI